jgi:hypothetical protein
MVETTVEKMHHLDESTGLSVTDMTHLQKRSHVDHAKHMLEFEPTFNVLALKNIEKLCLKDIAAVTRIPDEILKG